MPIIIKSFAVGNGDTYYIRHSNSNFSIIDCNLTDTRKEKIVDEIISESRNKDITRFISTHPDEDHIRGIKYLFQRKYIPNFYCVENQATKDDSSESFDKYCELRDSPQAYYLEKGCTRCWMNKDDNEKKYGSAGIKIKWPVVTNEHYKAALQDAHDGKSPNNISPIITYSLTDGVRAIWMGDLETAFMEKIKDDVTLTEVDILFAPHHGHSTGKPPKKWMDAMNPTLIVIGEGNSDDLDYYRDYTHICQNTAKDLVFECETGCVNIYAENPYELAELENKKKYDNYGLKYMGSIKTKKR